MAYALRCQKKEENVGFGPGVTISETTFVPVLCGWQVP